MYCTNSMTMTTKESSTASLVVWLIALAGTQQQPADGACGRMVPAIGSGVSKLSGALPLCCPSCCGCGERFLGML